VNGGVRSLAILHIVPSNSYVRKIIQYASLKNNKDLQFWTIAATPGWPKKLTKKLLEQAINFSELKDTKRAALAALNGKYLKWKHL